MTMTTTFRRTRVMLAAVALAAALIAPAWATESRAIAIGPYVQDVSQNLATICWATVSGQVTYAKSGSETATITDYDHHSVLLRDLEPGTTYTYNVLGDGSDAGKATFTTLPQGEHPFTFMILGDTQNRDNPAHRPIVERIMAGKPDMVFNTGDLVSDGHDILDWESFFKVNADLMRTIPYYAALGNHERDSRFYFDFFALPGNERYYSFNRGAAHLVVLDTPGPDLPETNQALTPADEQRFQEREEQYWQQQMQWFKDDLAGHPDAKYIFVFFHYPPYSVLASRVQGARQVRERFGSVFQDYSVSAVFSGHDHNYHRAAAGGVQFVVAGVSGGHPRPTDAPQPESVKYASAVTFVRVDVGAEESTVRVIGLDGAVIDEFKIPPRVKVKTP